MFKNREARTLVYFPRRARASRLRHLRRRISTSLLDFFPKGFLTPANSSYSSFFLVVGDAQISFTTEDSCLSQYLLAFPRCSLDRSSIAIGRVSGSQLLLNDRLESRQDFDESLRVNRRDTGLKIDCLANA
jgi:hypothetical protein